VLELKAVQHNVSVSADSQHQVQGLTREECCKMLFMTGTATSEVGKNWKTSLTVRDLQLKTVPEVKVLMHAEPQVTISVAANEVVFLYGSAQAILTEELQVRQLCSVITDRRSKAMLKDNSR